MADIIIPNVSYEFPYTSDITSLKIVTETSTGEVISVNTIPQSVITELTTVENIVLPNVSYEVPYTEDTSSLKIVTTLADDTVIGINNLVKKNIYDLERRGTQELTIIGNDILIKNISITEIIPNALTGQILYSIEGLIEGYVNKTDLEAYVNADNVTLPNGTILKYIITTSDIYTSPEISTINLQYDTTNKTYINNTSPRNLTHMINKLDGEINGYAHVSGNKLITNKATIQNYRQLLSENDTILRHIDDAYCYRSVSISIEEIDYVRPLLDNTEVQIKKSERKSTTLISDASLYGKYAIISITIPKN